MVKGRVLVIAGSDSSGGAGLEADQKVLAAHGCYAMTATTALTAQNTSGVYDVHEVPPQFLRKQIGACFDDIGVDVVKIGMLASAATIVAVAESLKVYKPAMTVLDPVMVATSGAELLPSDTLRDLRTHLLPHTTILTPNVPEARLLLANTGSGYMNIDDVADLETIARSVHALGPEWVLLKGGHSPFQADGTVAKSESEKSLVVDVLVGPDLKVTRIETAYQHTRHTHGTGCSLASAIAANLSQEMDMPHAVRSACRYVEAAIRTAPGFGAGNGPLNHFHSTFMLPFSPNHFIDYLLEHADVAPVWHKFVNHPFVLALGDGSLPLESFRGYLIQDYLFLVHFARANALAAYKAKDMKSIARSAEMVQHIAKETDLHLTYCEGFGISRKEMEQTEENEACTAYTRYVLDIGQSEDWIGLQIALAPCLLGYGAIAKHLYAGIRTKKEDNPYWSWITNYAGEDYAEAVKLGSELLEKFAILQSPTRLEELVKIFIHATKMEIGFWEMYPYA